MTSNKGKTGPDQQRAETNGTHRSLRFLLIDDHSVVCRGLKQILSDAFPHADFGQGSNAAEALMLLQNEKWDVLLLDITLPGQSGLEVLAKAREMQPALPVLMVTMHPEDQYAMRALRSGAAGYITKESAPEQLVGAINKILAGGKYVSNALAEKLAGAVGARTDRPVHETLSDREYQIMRMIASGKVAKEISAELSLSAKTVSTYRARLLRKMHLRTNAEVIRYALQERLVD